MFMIDAMSRQPVYEQLIEQAERFVLKGILKSGDQMPSVRSLSLSLSVNPNTIQKAYAELDRRGILITVPGKGGFVSEQALTIVRADRRALLDTLGKPVRELRLAGVTEQELAEYIHRIYQEQEGSL